MAVCPSCGQDNPEGFRFCGACAAPMRGFAPVGVRKTVTVLFCDVTGSTALGERTDPEALRALLAAYFERMKGIVERHGGTVEKFIGDAVMAVFGVPVAHEDDALRACRASVEMRDAFPELGIEGRLGVTTGEVVAGTEERLATGDAVNVAARLEQAAEPGEVLIGKPTLELVRTAAVVEPLAPLALKGKSEPVPAFRLLAVPGPPERSHASRFVGRTRELSTLVESWDRALAQSSCELVTVVGDAGVGKSRLVAETLHAIEARVARGRCLPYGEGITYWPVVEVAKQLDAFPSDEEAAAAMRSLLGESDRPTSADEIAWAFRKLLEGQAPLVVCLDDLQWGEETFLDLVESIALLSAGAPLLLLCMARPELLERRPAWPAPLRLEPLPADDADALIGYGVPEALRRRIAERAGGNPLFITEMLALATEGGGLDVPPTLRALLAARLDQLDEGERRVLERGAVEGELFHRGAVQALAPDEPDVLPRLAALVRHELIGPARAQFPDEDAFRFRHLLIRDAAYDALPKAVRAKLHARFADWLDRSRTLVELDEVAGYHLEQAARYQAELGRADDALTLRAGDRLIAAGRRALDREDVRAAAALLERALSLTRPLRLDIHAELDLAGAVMQEPARAARVAEDATRLARDAGDETAEALARAMAVYYANMVAPAPPDELEALLLDVRPRLEAAGDHAALVHVWGALGFGVANHRGRYDDWAAAAQRARYHSLLDGRAGGPEFGIPLITGSLPADEALEAIERLLAERPSAWLRLSRGWLLGMLDRADEARELAQEASARLREQSGALWGEWILAELATLLGRDDEAAQRLRLLCDWLEQVEQLTFLEGYLPRLGRSLCLLGRFEEAEALAQRARALQQAGGPHRDPYSTWREVLARVHAHRGELAEAERLAREAVAAMEETDSLDEQAFALCDLGDVLATAGRTDDARAALEQALDRCRRKRNLALARRVGERLAELRAETQPAL